MVAPPACKNIMQREKSKVLVPLRRLRETVFGKMFPQKAWSDSALLIPEGWVLSLRQSMLRQCQRCSEP